MSLMLTLMHGRRQFCSRILLLCFIFSVGGSLFLPLSVSATDVPTFHGKKMVITATRYPKLKIDSPFSVSVIEAKDIFATGAENLAEVLQYTAGVDTKFNGMLGTTATIRLRGSTFQEVLVLLNGRRMNSALVGGCAAEDVRVDNIERVEVVRFPASSLYGAGALGGVVNVITKKPERGASIDTVFSSYEMSKYVIAASSGFLDFSAGYLTSGGYRANEDYLSQNYDAALDLGYVQFRFGYYLGEKGVPGSIVYPSTVARQTDRNSYLDLTLNGFKVYYDGKLERYNADPTLEADNNYNCWATGVEWQQTSYLPGQNLTFGIDWREEQSDSSGCGQHSINNVGLFLQDEIGSVNWLSFNLGLRGDQHSVAGGSLNPRAGVVVKLAEGLNFRSALGSAYRAPTLNDLYWYYRDPVWGMISRGSTALRPEKAFSVEMGLEKEINADSNISFSLYTMDTTDKIDWVDISGTWMTWEAQNIASAQTVGAELEIGIKPWENLKSAFNYTYQNVLDGNSGKLLVYSPRHKANFNLQYANSGGDGAGLFVKYVGERYDDATNLTLVPAYTVIDLKMWKEIKEWRFSFGIDNLLNEQYEDTLNYPLPRRRYTVSLKWQK